MVENIKKVSERANMTEIQKISVWTEWLTWVTDALGAWFAPGWCTKRTLAKTVIKERIIIIIIIIIIMVDLSEIAWSRSKTNGFSKRKSVLPDMSCLYKAPVNWGRIEAGINKSRKKSKSAVKESN